jgi:ubiquitin C-terminal hydrolase
LILQDPKETYKEKEESIALVSLRQVFQDMEEASKSASKRSVTPQILCKNLGIPVFQQQDSQEFWKLLLPSLKLQALTDLYQGAFEDYIVALDGSNRERRREEAFLDLSLDISCSNSVESSLQKLFGSPELLSREEGNGWRPEKGAETVDAHKGSLLKLSGLPPILQLHLKRFQYDWNTDTTSKLNCAVSFPRELDLSSLCSDYVQGANNNKDLSLYDLQAIVVHQGQYGAGHYYAYIRRDVRDDEWYRFNDETVEPVEWEEVFLDASGDKLADSKATSLLGRIRQALQGGSDSYGFGGYTSNAYVLQYVRRRDVPMLYDS